MPMKSIFRWKNVTKNIKNETEQCCQICKKKNSHLLISDIHKLFAMVPQITSSIISNKDVQQKQNILQVNSEF